MSQAAVVFSINEEEKKRIYELFEKYDADKSNSICKVELRKVLQDSMAKPLSEGLMNRYVNAEFEKHDKDGNGSIDFDEFMALYIKLYLDPELPVNVKPHPTKKAPLETGDNAPKIQRGLFKLSDEERAIAAKKFEEHDKDKSGTLDKEELRLVLKEKMPKASEKMVDRLLDAQFQLGDKNNDGMMSLDEFLEFYAKVLVSVTNQINPIMPLYVAKK